MLGSLEVGIILVGVSLGNVKMYPIVKLFMDFLNKGSKMEWFLVYPKVGGQDKQLVQNLNCNPP